MSSASLGLGSLLQKKRIGRVWFDLKVQENVVFVGATTFVAQLMLLVINAISVINQQVLV